MKSRLFALSLIAASVALPAAAPVSAPRVGVASFEALAKPLPLPYHAGDAKAAIAAARARAVKAHKRVLIDLGAIGASTAACWQA